MMPSPAPDMMRSVSTAFRRSRRRRFSLIFHPAMPTADAAAMNSAWTAAQNHESSRGADWNTETGATAPKTPCWIAT